MIKYKAAQSILNSTQNANLIADFQKKILTCKFLDQTCDFQADFIVYPNTEYLYCFKYNSNVTNAKTTSMSGMLNGLQFSYYIGDQQSHVLTNKRGLRVFIHDQTELYPNDYIDLQPGVETNIALKRTIYQHLPYPYTNCIADLSSNNNEKTKVMQYMFSQLNVISYTYSLCQDIVFSMNLDQVCNCTDKSYLLTDLPHLCHSSEQIDCLNTFRASFSHDISSNCPLGIIFESYNTS